MKESVELRLAVKPHGSRVGISLAPGAVRESESREIATIGSCGFFPGARDRHRIVEVFLRPARSGLPGSRGTASIGPSILFATTMRAHALTSLDRDPDHHPTPDPVSAPRPARGDMQSGIEVNERPAEATPDHREPGRTDQASEGTVGRDRKTGVATGECRETLRGVTFRGPEYGASSSLDPHSAGDRRRPRHVRTRGSGS